jgi:hypothetical protein
MCLYSSSPCNNEAKIRAACALKSSVYKYSVLDTRSYTHFDFPRREKVKIIVSHVLCQKTENQEREGMLCADALRSSGKKQS